MLDKDLRNFIKNALKEDLGDGDHTSLASIPKNTKSKAHLLVKDNGMIAGIELAKMILSEVDSSLKITQNLNDGDKVKFGDIAFIVEGNSIAILKAGNNGSLKKLITLVTDHNGEPILISPDMEVANGGKLY